jgi:hypothetical protein
MADVERPDVWSHTDRHLAKKLEAASWGAFLVWVGFALLMEVPIGVGLLGVGVVALAAQAARKVFGLYIEGFWIFVGVAFLIAGAWRVLAIETPLAPVLLVSAGLLLLAGALLRRR